MFHLPTSLPEEPCVPSALQVSDPSNSTGEEDETDPEPEPLNARTSVEGEEDSQLLGSIEEYAELGDYNNEEFGEKMPADISSAERPRLYVKSMIPARQDMLDRRARKNAKSRARASKLRERIDIIASKPENERTQEEQELLDKDESRRSSKNNRSRKRATEKKIEVERILAIPEKKRSKIERDFLENTMEARSRKNLGDRIRRQRIKQSSRQRIKQSKMATPAAGVGESFANGTTYSSTGESRKGTLFQEKTEV
jgi:hypothetical protein